MSALLAMAWGPTPFQDALNAAGPQAARIERLYWLIFWISIVVFFLVIATMSGAVATRHIRKRGLVMPEPILDTEASDRVARKIVGVALALTVITLFVLLVESVVAAKNETQGLVSKNPVSIQVIGHQWWWEVVYPNTDPSQMVTTANEIHIPVGVPVVLNTASRDVIHSFWAPNLQGKRDLIPGYTTALWFQADRPGVFRGQCAEFCGLQHAKMAFYIVAEEPAKFQQWLQQQIRPAPSPDNDQKRHGQQVFESNACVMCHTIRGTIAGSRVGPDLTHIASRISLAAGTLPNNPGNLAAWIVDSQSIKPGNRMPPNMLPASDLQDLLTYLESLN
jgi:cytochrome c oxidase subunit II